MSGPLPSKVLSRELRPWRAGLATGKGVPGLRDYQRQYAESLSDRKNATCLIIQLVRPL